MFRTLLALTIFVLFFIRAFAVVLSTREYTTPPIAAVPAPFAAAMYISKSVFTLESFWTSPIADKTELLISDLTLVFKTWVLTAPLTETEDAPPNPKTTDKISISALEIFFM